jgi:hypothetical protein
VERVCKDKKDQKEKQQWASVFIGRSAELGRGRGVFLASCFLICFCRNFNMTGHWYYYNKIDFNMEQEAHSLINDSTEAS